MVLDRRRLLRSTSAAGLGITSLALPAAAQAASFEGVALASTAPQNLTVDDTGTVLGGHDVTLRITLRDVSGSAYSGNVRVDLTVRLDDGSNGGDGSAVAGTVIEGSARSSISVLSTDGTATLSIGFPASGTYLLSLATSPAVAAHPNGVTLARTHTA